VIYDAAHAFGVRYKTQSVLKHGDLSVLSFHATKVFNTFEGGAIVCPDAKTKQRIDYLKNFGIADEVTVVAPGINGKMSEIQAAFGMLQLRHIDQAIHRRQAVDRLYRDVLANCRGITLLQPPADTVHNYSYFPILIESDYPITRDQLYEGLRRADIYARRYFYPLISDMPMYRGLPSAAVVNLSVAKSIADRILCLPIYPDMTEDDHAKIIQIVSR
jgi:dTDP-4-amino-4,6-dideoxygalactose transaminase